MEEMQVKPGEVVTIRELMEELPGGQLYVALVEDEHGIRRLVANMYSVACYCGVVYGTLCDWFDEQGYECYVRTNVCDDRWCDREIVEELMLMGFKGLLARPKVPEAGGGKLTNERQNNGRKTKTR